MEKSKTIMGETGEINVMGDNKLLYQVKPKFNFVYEIFMPNARKTRNTFFAFLLFIIIYIVFAMTPNTNILKSKMIEVTNSDISYIFNNVYLWFLVLLAVKILVHLVIQIWQYNSIYYSFYNDYLEYADMFLNQQKKTMLYNNIREIEIRKTIWDRINGYGTIIIYTNAEKSYGNGLILYSIKDPQKVYDQIDQIVHSKNSKNNDYESESFSNSTISEKEIEFENSLKNDK